MEINFISKINLVNDIWELEFSKPSAFVYEAGDYVELAVPSIDAKMLSMSSNPSEQNLKFTIRIPNKPSQYKQALKKMSIDDKCFISPAIGNFNLPKTGKSKLVFIAFGIGITPYRSILLEGSLPEIKLIYSAKDVEHIYEDVINKSDAKYVKVENFSEVKTALQAIDNLAEQIIYIAGPEQPCVQIYAELLGARIARTNIKLEYFTGY